MRSVSSDDQGTASDSEPEDGQCSEDAEPDEATGTEGILGSGQGLESPEAPNAKLGSQGDAPTRGVPPNAVEHERAALLEGLRLDHHACVHHGNP